MTPSEPVVGAEAHDDGVRIQVPAALDGERVDRALAATFGCSRSQASDAIAAGGVRLNDTAVSSRSLRVATDDWLTVAGIADREDAGPQPDPSIDVRWVFVDDQIVVVDKPVGLVVHPAPGHRDGTLVNAALAQFPEMAEVGERERPGVVHRLDRDTSGLMVMARTAEAYEYLVEELLQRRVRRSYVAGVIGGPEHDSGLIDAPIGRSTRDPTAMAVVHGGKPAMTEYDVTERFATSTLLRCRLHSGRTHQIRVHLRSIRLPLIGDRKYGRVVPALGLERPFLHSATLQFEHPATGEMVGWESDLPADLTATIDKMRAH